MTDILYFKNEHCEEEFYKENDSFGYAKITYAKDYESCDDEDVINNLDENNQIIINLDKYRSFGDGSFDCTTKDWKQLSGDEDCILKIESCEV